MNRFAALHDWPVLSRRACAAASTTSSRFSVASRMNGSEPPISRTTFFRLRPATSATAAPARSEPVTETPRTRGAGGTLSAICSGHARVGDHLLGYLLVCREDRLIRTLREAGVVVHGLNRFAGFRALWRRLQQ